MTVHLVSLDGGYGYTKAINGDRKIVSPSLIAPAVNIKYQSSLAGNGQGVTVEVDGQAWFVGERAQLQGTDPISPRARDRSARVMQVLALGALHRLGITHGRVRMVTGLPVKWYEDRDKLKSMLLGPHNFQANGEQCSVTIEDMLVVPQPFGSLFRTLLTPGGVLLDEDGLRNAKVGVLDVGMYTSDYALANKLHYVEEGSSSIPYAMSRVCELLQDRVSQKHGRELTLREAEEAVQTAYFTDRGERVYVGRMLNEVLDSVVERVIGEAQTLWGDARDLVAVLVTGGGGPVLMDRIREVYSHARLVPSPQTANAEQCTDEF